MKQRWHNEKFAVSGVRSIVTAIVKYAYLDYWAAYRKCRRFEEILEICNEPDKRAIYKRLLTERKKDLIEVEDFFYSTWYDDLIEAAPMLYSLKFDDFKKDLAKNYEIWKTDKSIFKSNMEHYWGKEDDDE